MTGVPISNLFKTFDLFDLLALNLHQCLKIFPLYPSSALTCCFGVVVIAVPNINKKTGQGGEGVAPVKECPNCHTVHDRDVNAANNILAEGLRLLA